MGISYVDRVKETTETSGNGPQFFLKGPVAEGAYRGFVDKIGNGKECAVLIENAELNQWATYAARIVQATPEDYLDCYYLSASSNNDGPVNFQPGVKEVSCIIAGGDIQEISQVSRLYVDGGDVTYNPSLGFVLGAGECSILGFMISWPALNGPGVSGHDVSKMGYIYIHDDDEDRIGEIEFSSTAPVYNAVERYLQKTGDPTRRMVNAVMVNAAGVIPRFYSQKRGATIFMDYGEMTADAQLFSGSVPLVWTELTGFPNVVPYGCLRWDGRLLATMPSQNNELAVALDSELIAGRAIENAKSVATVVAGRDAFAQGVDFASVICDWADPRAYILGAETGANTTDVFVRGWEMTV